MNLDLDEAAVARLLRMEELIPTMERALAAFSSGEVVQPTRVMVPAAEHQGFLGANAFKKASADRIQELLRICNWLAAPFGSQEHMFLN